MKTEHIYIAEWVLSENTLIRHGAVAVANNRIRALGPGAELTRQFPDAETSDLGAAILLPGLVNAHTHLSLTQLPDPPPRGSSFFNGLKQIAISAGTLTETAVRTAVRAGIETSLALGTAAVGEITTRTEGVLELAEDSRLAARVYFEFLGVQEPAALERFALARERATELDRIGGDHIQAGLSPHAPYTVWPSLWEETHRLSQEANLFWSTHLAEAPEEDRFLREGSGSVVDYLDFWGIWDGTFPIPGKSAVHFLEEKGFLNHRALLVHGVHLTPDEMERIAGSGAYLCLCPRSNAYLDLPPPPVRDLVDHHIPLCLGTDSLGSNEDLSVWAEMREIHNLVPDLPARDILDMATGRGAQALGLSGQAGSLRAEMPFRAIAVETSGLAEKDVLEYLVREPVEGRVRRLS